MRMSIQEHRYSLKYYKWLEPPICLKLHKRAWLPIAGFAYNNRQHSSTGRLPFFVNLRKYPNIYEEGKEST